jgi:hypothetical protein
MALAIAALLVTVFCLNVAMGAMAGASCLGDVSEMLVLLVASIAFVAAIIRAEMKSRQDDKS